MKLPPFHHVRCLRASAILTLVLVVLALTEVNIPILTALELKTRDLRFLLRGVEKPSGKVVIVAVDDKSLETRGRWPWPRSQIAQLIAILYEHRAKAVGVDFLFTEPEVRPELSRIRELIGAYRELGLLNSDIENQAFWEEMQDAAAETDNDALLSAIIREAGNVILPLVFVPSKDPSDRLPPALSQTAYELAGDSKKQNASQTLKFQGRLLPIPDLAQAASSLAFVNVLPDQDGASRQAVLVLEHGGKHFLSFPLHVVRKHLGLEKTDVALFLGKKFQMGSSAIPLDAKNRFHVNYYGPSGTLPHYSFTDVLNGEVPPKAFDGKSVFIGGAAVGLGDHWPSPFSKNFWGVELQATIADNILSQRFLLRPHWIRYADAGIILALGLVSGLLLFRLPIGRWCLFLTCLIFLFIAASQYVFTHHHLLLLWIYPLLEIGGVSLSVLLFRYLSEGREKQTLKKAFQHYMNPSVVNRILRHPENLALGGEKKELTVLFSDIRSFTSISEGLSPEALVSFMNQYLTLMSDIILRHEGTLDKYIGDAIMAIYGAPEDQKDHAIRACGTAIDMIEALGQVRERWRRAGLPAVSIGIGVNTGEMVVGNIGSERRFDYTVMGDHVNLGSRLEGLTKVYGVNILVSESVQRMAADHFSFRELDRVRVKGKEKPVRVFELFTKHDAKQSDDRLILFFHKGLEAYRRQEWDKATECFEAVLRLNSGDNPARLFIERCQAMRQMPLSQKWDGVYMAMEK